MDEPDLTFIANDETTKLSTIIENSSLDPVDQNAQHEYINDVDTGHEDYRVKPNASHEVNLGHNTPSTLQGGEQSGHAIPSVPDMNNLEGSRLTVKEFPEEAEHLVPNMESSRLTVKEFPEEAEHLGHLILKRSAEGQSKEYDCNEDIIEDVKSTDDSVIKTKRAEDDMTNDDHNTDVKNTVEFKTNQGGNLENSKPNRDPIGKVLTSFLRAKEAKYSKNNSTEEAVQSSTPVVKYEVETRRSSTGNETIYIIKVIAPPIEM
ncbi:hypothetical protein WDU94_007756 [Cyamophila willieti]